MIEQKKQHALLLAGSAFTISTTLGQVISIQEPWIKLAILIPNLVAWGYVSWVYWHYRVPLPSKRQVESLAEVFDSESVSFRYARTEIELDHLWRIDNEIYGIYNIRKETYYGWFSRFHSGTLMMFRGPRFIGYVGIFPLTGESFNRLKTGLLAEDDIGPNDICSDEMASVCATWYFSGYALYDASLFPVLVAEALRAWASRIPADHFIEAISFAVPGVDELFFTKLGFVPVSVERKTGQLPIVYRTFDQSEILNLAHSVGRKAAVHSTS
jgi:hypothetical protein